MGRTYRGVYHNLNESTYVITNGEIMISFSSMQYMRKFLDRYKENRGILRDKFFQIFGTNDLNADMLSDLGLYQNIEKRGFKIWIDGVDITCNEIYRYALRKATEKNTLDWCATQRAKSRELKKITI